MNAGDSGGILATHVPEPALRTVRQIMERGFNTPMTSSAGRLFDAVSAIATGRTRVSFEGQAAMELEWLAGDSVSDDSYPWEMKETPSAWIIDTSPLIRAVAADRRNGHNAGEISRRFHRTMADLIVTVCARLRENTAVNDVVLSGGVFMNALLMRTAVQRLTEMGFSVYRHHKVPPNDGGLCLGQLAIAAERLRRRSE